MDTRPTQSRWHGILLAGVVSLTGGCFHTQAVVVPPPPDGSVPTELNKVVLPRYVIEAPDVLLVQVLLPPENYLKQPRGADAASDKAGAKEPSGPPPGANPPTGTNPAAGGTNPAAGASNLPAAYEDALRYYSSPLTPAPIDGNHLVQMDGTIDLGIYGSVPVAGMTIDQAREQVRAFVAKVSVRRLDTIQVRVSVVAYNSKQFYIITDGAGYGEKVTALAITGSETVLDAMARIGGLPDVSSKRDIWIARRSPGGSPDQILPVCWEEITKQGIARTNYQVLPGDRIYVQSQKLISFDNALAKFLQPVERVLGIVLLGSETVNSIGNRTTNGTVP
jgi:polysaccharide export outer membrane protein